MTGEVRHCRGAIGYVVRDAFVRVTAILSPFVIFTG